MIIEWNAETVSKIISEHYEKLSRSDQLTLQQICTRALRKTLPGWTRKTTPPTA